MATFLRKKDTGELLTVVNGKIFFDQEEAKRKNITASFLTCRDVNNVEHLVCFAYTLTGEMSERNNVAVIDANEAEAVSLLFNLPSLPKTDTEALKAEYEVLSEQAITNVETHVIDEGETIVDTN